MQGGRALGRSLTALSAVLQLAAAIRAANDTSVLTITEKAGKMVESAYYLFHMKETIKNLCLKSGVNPL